MIREPSLPIIGVVRFVSTPRRPAIRDRTRQTIDADLLAGLSIRIFADREADEWRQPATRGGLPLVVRRGVEIRETSLVVWPAYPGAVVSGVHVRTVDGERRHVESVVAIASARKASAEAEAWLAARRR